MLAPLHRPSKSPTVSPTVLAQDFDLVRFAQDEHGIYVLDSSNHTISSLKSHWPTFIDAEEAVGEIWIAETTKELDEISGASPVERYLECKFVH